MHNTPPPTTLPSLYDEIIAIPEEKLLLFKNIFQFFFKTYKTYYGSEDVTTENY